jgi:hypothetical protein
MTRVRVFLAFGAVVLALGAAACGGSSSSASSGSSSTPPATSTPPPSSSTGNVSGGGSGFCGTGKADINKLHTDLANLQSIASEPQKLQEMFATILAAYSNAESQAPSEIKGDIQVAYDFMKKLNDVFKAHQYNIVASAAQAQTFLTGPEHTKLVNASKHLQAWAKANCGA